MFFRILENFLFAPYPFMIAFAFVVFRLYKKECKDKFLWLGVGIVGLCFLMTSGLVYSVFVMPLRSWIPENTMTSADVVVSLGSNAQIMGAPTSGSAERAYLGAQAYLFKRAPYLLLTGFSGADSLGGAKAMRIVARGMGVPDGHIVMVGGRNSYEEATIGGQVLSQKHVRKIILATSWYHIPRAKWVWEKQGFEVVTHTYLPNDTWHVFFGWAYFSKLKLICHEYAGILVYKLRGWI